MSSLPRQARIAAVASAFKQADEASRSDSESSAERRDLPKKIQDWKLSLGKYRNEEKALLEAGKVLDDLIENASLENATREALDAIGDQINAVFSRIHSPREYEYVGTARWSRSAPGSVRHLLYQSSLPGIARPRQRLRSCSSTTQLRTSTISMRCRSLTICATWL
jgi:hypothetical protein